MGHANPSAREAKDILMMKALADIISPVKEDFIIVYLQPVCSHCLEVPIVRKEKVLRLCLQCKNYQLCERCHEEEYSGQGESHISSSGQKHTLSKETVNDDDSFRRARHSSMMILYHLHNQKKPGL